TQSGVSHILNNLEKDWGFALFHRTKNGVVLTSNGKYLIPFVMDVVNKDQILQQEIKLINGLNYGEITVGTFPSVTTKWMPKLIKIMEERYPFINVNILEENYENLEKSVLAGEIDCAFIANPSKNSKLTFNFLIKDQFFCLVNKNNK